MLNDFLSLFLGAYDSLIGREFSEWYLLRGVLPLLFSACFLLSLWLAWVVIRALASWTRPSGGDLN